jgi:hypothetical protein
MCLCASRRTLLFLSLASLPSSPSRLASLAGEAPSRSHWASTACRHVHLALGTAPTGTWGRGRGWDHGWDGDLGYCTAPPSWPPRLKFLRLERRATALSRLRPTRHHAVSCGSLASPGLPGLPGLLSAVWPVWAPIILHRLASRHGVLAPWTCPIQCVKLSVLA